jgi:hypothetical protein
MRVPVRTLISAAWRFSPTQAFGDLRRAREEATDFALAPADEIPILVYSMANVEASTVVRTLESIGLERAVHHVHRMTPTRIRTGIRRHLPVGIGLPYDRLLGHALGDKVRQADSPQIPVITLVRDPIDRGLSGFFQAVATDSKLRSAGRLDGERVLEHLERRLRLDDASREAKAWFDHEVKQMLGIDVFALPFARQTGYAIYQSRRARMLLLRTEDLDRVLGPAIAELLDLQEPPKLVRATERAASSDRDLYDSVVEKFRLPRSEVDRVYADSVTRHFYPPDAIDRFTERWSRPVL